MTMLSDIDLVTQFESLGDNCELGLVQRRVGAEPLGLLRFGGIALANLVQALHARFQGISTPEDVEIIPDRNEYMVALRRWGIYYHADARVDAVDAAALHRQQARIVPFLVDKLVADLSEGEKIMVFRQNEPLLANDLLDLRAALATYGPVILLWVQGARLGHPAGSVDVVDDRLMVGHVTALAPRGDVPSLDVASWITMLRTAHALRSAAARTAVPTAAMVPERIDVAFGIDGNAAAYLGAGWSGQENGFCWAVGDRSVLRIPGLQPATRFRIEMDVTPFVSVPAVCGQRLRMLINGREAHSFRQLPRDVVAFSIPGELMRRPDAVEIVFEHPDATSPRQATGEDDDRRLAIAFRRLSVSGLVS